MLEAITILQETEDNCIELKQKAIETAQKILENAKTEVAKQQDSMINAAHIKRKDILSKAEEKAQAACEVLESQANKSIDAILNPSSEDLKKVSNALIELLCGTPTKGEPYGDS